MIPMSQPTAKFEEGTEIRFHCCHLRQPSSDKTLTDKKKKVKIFRRKETPKADKKFSKISPVHFIIKISFPRAMFASLLFISFTSSEHPLKISQ